MKQKTLKYSSSMTFRIFFFTVPVIWSNFSLANAYREPKP